jgi:hypothetical protein
VAVVPRVLLDHVGVHPAHADLLVAMRVEERLVEVVACRRLSDGFDFAHVGGQRLVQGIKSRGRLLASVQNGRDELNQEGRQVPDFKSAQTALQSAILSGDKKSMNELVGYTAPPSSVPLRGLPAQSG